MVASSEEEEVGLSVSENRVNMKNGYPSISPSRNPPTEFIDAAKTLLESSDISLLLLLLPYIT